MSSDSWEEDGGTIGNKYVWKYYGLRDSDFRDRRNGEDREELGINVYRTGEDEPIAYYSVGLSYQGDGPDIQQQQKEKHFIEQLQQNVQKGQELQFLKRKGILLFDIPAEEAKPHKEDTSYSDKCPPGYEYVYATFRRDHTYVKGYCRKSRNKY